MTRFYLDDGVWRQSGVPGVYVDTHLGTMLITDTEAADVALRHAAAYQDPGDAAHAAAIIDRLLDARLFLTSKELVTDWDHRPRPLLPKRRRTD